MLPEVRAAPFLTSLRRRQEYSANTDAFPWSLALIQNIDQIDFTSAVTFLVGENGSGKSTLLEGIASGMDAVAVGSNDLQHDPSLTAARALAQRFFFARKRHARTRLFLRAEALNARDALRRRSNPCCPSLGALASGSPRPKQGSQCRL
jgi:predicted ATPase